MKQMELTFTCAQGITLKNVVRESYSFIKKKYPKPVAGESIEEYREFITDETLLEISERIRDVALKRQIFKEE